MTDAALPITLGYGLLVRSPAVLLAARRREASEGQPGTHAAVDC
ncbi:hypothetical protein [Micromonospora sp. KC606]|nr:hypothetical protein [Micromonospora sp. KC606]